MADNVRYLAPVDVITKTEKILPLQKAGIKYIDYKDPDFLMRFVNEQGKILPRRLTGTSLNIKEKFLKQLTLSSFGFHAICW